MIKSTAINREDFNLLVELAMQEEGYSHMRPVIEKELLHYDLLFALDNHQLERTYQSKKLKSRYAMSPHIQEHHRL